jgi:hypothetical protein
MTLSVARSTAEPPTVSAPEPPFPLPAPSASVSPDSTCTREGGTPSRSATIWVKAVSLPCPIVVEPAKRVTEPSGFTRICAVSGFTAV